MLREGWAMLRAILSDLTAIPGTTAVTTLDRRLSSLAGSVAPPVLVHLCDESLSEQAAFDCQVAVSDVTLVIAPETDGILAQRVQRVLQLGGRSLNCGPPAIQLCGDKLRLAEYLLAHGIPTIPTAAVQFDSPPWDSMKSSCVLKPRDGAGSWLTFAIGFGDLASWNCAIDQFRRAGAADRAIVQPFVSGQALSVGCLCHEEGFIEVLPIARQHISPSRLQYEGGTIPAEISDKSTALIRELIEAACRTIPGLRGYVGFDVILPMDQPGRPVLVEINPRLTTSYAGYRQLCHDNLAEQLLRSCLQPGCWATLRWKRGQLSFAADGSEVEWKPDESTRHSN